MARRKNPDDEYDEFEDQASQPDPFQKRDDGFFSPSWNEPRLPQDYEPPASPPSDVSDKLPSDYPESDTNLEPSEVYDEGVGGATDADAQEVTEPFTAERLQLESDEAEDTGEEDRPKNDSRPKKDRKDPPKDT